MGRRQNSAISSQFETGKSRLVADLSGEWSRFGPLCLGLARFRLLVPEAHRPVLEGISRVSSLFSGRFVQGVIGGALPTLKTGNGESRSWVRIPPHPFFWNGFFSAAEGLFRPSEAGAIPKGLARGGNS